MAVTKKPKPGVKNIQKKAAAEKATKEAEKAEKATKEAEKAEKAKYRQKKKRAKAQVADLRTTQTADINAIRTLINTETKGEVAQPVTQKPVIIIPTGILSMDIAIANMGLVGGRVLDIFGWEQSGKTLTCLTIAGYIQRCTKIDNQDNVIPRVAAFLDAEGTFDMLFAASAGVNIDNLILVQSTPDRILSGEDYFDIMVLLIQQGVDYIIVDSCPALTPAQVLMKGVGQGQKATNASLMSEGLQKITAYLNASGQSLVHFINQKRGVPMAQMFQPSEKETGGNALKFYSSYRFEVVSFDDIMSKVLLTNGSYIEKKVGVTSRIEIIKNKTAPTPPPMTGKKYHFEYDIYFEPFVNEEGLEFNRGVDIVKDYVDTGLRLGVIKQSSSWFKFGSLKCNGKSEMIQQLRRQPEVMNQIRDEVFAAISPTASSSDDIEEEQTQAAG